jgi:LuxR family maltose regulon positive regulatory protein
LRTKLQPPLSRAGVVERTAVVDRLARARRRRFVSVVAPPGYGKTTALGQWAATDGRPFGWLSLDHRDNDPVVLLTYLAEALNTDGSIQAAVFKAITGPGDSVWASGLPRLAAALARREQPVVLVLDDVHVLHDHRCLDALVILAQHVPEGSQLVLSGRMEAPLGLATMRAKRELLELDATALALTDAEAQALLAAAGVELTEAEAASLNAHAEGWAAGLYLAALSLAGGSSLASFGGDDRFVADYLRSEELSRASAQETEFLLRSSVLETMSAPLCDAVLERTDSARMLEKLERSNLFVVALDHRRRWFRYHHLFREMLQAEFEREDPALVSELNRRAASWCEAGGRTEEAIEYSLAAGDTDGLARLVAASTFPYYRTGRVTTVERWLETFDEAELLHRFPAIATFGVWLHALRGRPDATLRWAAALEGATADQPMPDGSPLDAWAATVRALLCRRGVEQMLVDAEAAIEGLTATSPWRPVSLLLRGIATLLLGDAERAEVMLLEAAEAAVAGGAVWAGVVARSELALLALERGDSAAAEAEVALARAFVDDTPSTDYVVTALLQAACARVSVAQGRRARARQALAGAQRLRPVLTHALSWFSVQVQLELATVHLDLHDPRGAATLYAEAEDVLRRRPRLGTLAAAAEAVRARIATTTEESSGWASTLTAAELRLLPLLTTHLSFREIAERLFVSRNTVKTQAISIYRKLDASSRSEAIERAAELGLVDSTPAALVTEFTRSG